MTDYNTLNRRIVIDVDGVMLDWFQGFTSFMADKLHVIPAVSSAAMYDLSDMYPGQDVSACISTFNRSPEFGELLPVEGAQAGVARIIDLYGIENVGWLSSCVPTGLGTSGIPLRRHLNIQQYFGRIHGSCIPVGEPKSLYVGSDVRAIVEDSAENAKDIYHNTNVRRVFLIDRPYNQSLRWAGDVLVRTADWPGTVKSMESSTAEWWNRNNDAELYSSKIVEVGL